LPDAPDVGRHYVGGEIRHSGFFYIVRSSVLVLPLGYQLPVGLGSVPQHNLTKFEYTQTYPQQPREQDITKQAPFFH